MAVKASEKDSLTMAVPVKEKPKDEPRVRVMLPELENPGDGVTIDQYEHVTIANELGEKVYYIKRGEPVDVTVPVFEQLKLRYPKL